MGILTVWRANGVMKRIVRETCRNPHLPTELELTRIGLRAARDDTVQGHMRTMLRFGHDYAPFATEVWERAAEIMDEDNGAQREDWAAFGAVIHTHTVYNPRGRHEAYARLAERASQATWCEGNR